ncbi:hypothetical protein B7494_g2627 [Chlorociboria aeruginascens]|nr:hypothetical protein B7494_g2627 [Chlorociboria aeruginascens]
MSSKSEVLENAREILRRTEQLVQYLEQNGYEEPSFKATSPAVPDTPQYIEIRDLVSNAASNLIHLVNGPLNWLRSLFFIHYDLAAWQIALEFEFFKAIPLRGTIELSELAKKVCMDEERVARVLRLLATQKTFFEPEPGVFQHTAISSLIATDDSIHAVLAMQSQEMFQAASETTACIQKAPFDSGTRFTPFASRHGLPVYAWYNEHPEQGARFALAMAGSTKMDRQISELCDFPWLSLKGNKIVNQYPNLNFVVQDIYEKMLAQAFKDSKMEALKDRITFMQYDFFQPQPIHDANAYFLRQVIHNYNDIDAIRIFRNFVPALERCLANTPLLINDTILPQANEVSAFEEHPLRQVDMAMLVVVGAKQRTTREFLELLKKADERYTIVKVYKEGSMGLLEVILQKQ